MATDTTALRLRCWTCVTTLPLLFLALLAATLVSRVDSDAGLAEQVRQAAAHQGSAVLEGWLEMFAAVVGIGVVATLSGAVRRRGSGWANAGAVLGAFGCLGMAMIGVHTLIMYAVAKGDPGRAVTVLHTLDNAAGPVVILFFAMPIALVLFAVAAYRAGLARLPVLILAVVFFVADLVPGLPAGEEIQLVAGLVAFSWIGWNIVRGEQAVEARHDARVPAVA